MDWCSPKYKKGFSWAENGSLNTQVHKIGIVYFYFLLIIVSKVGFKPNPSIIVIDVKEGRGLLLKEPVQVSPFHPNGVRP